MMMRPLTPDLRLVDPLFPNDAAALTSGAVKMKVHRVSPANCFLCVCQAQTTLTTNDIVISKLTQILSYLRQGTRHKKIKKKDKG